MTEKNKANPTEANPKEAHPEEAHIEETKNGESKQNLRQAVKFTLFSISAGLIQIVTYVLFYEVFHWAPWLSYLVSLILSVVWNFTLNRTYTFRSDAPLTGENPFTGAGVSSEPLVNNYLVQAATMAINFVTEFLWQRFVVFRGRIDTKTKAQK